MPRGRKDMPPGPGRPKGSKNSLPFGIAKLIRDKTQDGELLVNTALEILTGTATYRVRVEHRLGALHWLSDRGWGKAREIIELLNENGASLRVPIDKLSSEDLLSLREILRRASAGDQDTE